MAERPYKFNDGTGIPRSIYRRNSNYIGGDGEMLGPWRMEETLKMLGTPEDRRAAAKNMPSVRNCFFSALCTSVHTRRVFQDASS